MATILSRKDALKTIKLIATAGRKLDERIHSVAVSGLHHFFESGDLDILTDLVKSMPKSGRGNALRFWVTMHAPVQWDKKAYAGKGGWKKKGDIPENWGDVVASADAAPFYDQTDKEPAQFNPEQYAKSVANKLAKEGVSLDEFIALVQSKAAPKPSVEAVSVQ